jgi:hypothetical protein
MSVSEQSARVGWSGDLAREKSVGYRKRPGGGRLSYLGVSQQAFAAIDKPAGAN